MRKPDGHPEFPVWKLERYLLGELPAAELETIRARRETDPLLGEWIRALEAEHRDLAEMHPTGRVAGRIWNRLREGSPASRRAWAAPRIWVPAMGVLMVALMMPLHLGGWRFAAQAPAVDREETRLKGLPPTLYLYRKTGESASGLKSGDGVRPGELIQIHYDAAGRGYGAIFSIDRHGEVTWHLPDSGGHAVPLAKGGKVPLSFAFELDSLPGYERFFFITGNTPFDLDDALARIAKSSWESDRGPDSLFLAPGLSQSSMVLMKAAGI